MIARILDSIEAVVSGRFPAHTRFGLAAQWPTDGGIRPFELVGGGQGRPILEDSNGNLSYWRITGKIEQRRTDQCDEVTWILPLRLAYLIDATSDTCDDVPAAMLDIMLQVGTMERAVQTAIQGASATFLSIGAEVGTIRAAAAESPGLIPPPQKAFCYLDMTLSVQGTEECLQICDTEPYDPCANCGDGPCEDATVEINGVEVATVASGGTSEIEVLQGGSPVGSLVGDQWIIPECPGGGCLFDLIVNVDGVQVETQNDVDPCVDNVLNVNITYS